MCPEHGNTLQATGGRAWCTASLCPREWGYDRLSNPCTEPATYKITDQKGAVALFCDGHAMDASKNLEGATTTPLEPEAEDGGHD
ncbi:hypothetical protein ACFQWA_27895 [Streptomyces thermogriseus]|uniref:hypothetical protein n=1 Tax=Streptomyces thermogriseus TaxID=75292 RepID=UPI0036120D9E